MRSVEDPAVGARWIVTRSDPPQADYRVVESLFALADGTIGTRGATEEPSGRKDPLVMASGVFDERDGRSRPLGGPGWTEVDGLEAGPAERDLRSLDLHRGVLSRWAELGDTTIESVRFVSMTHPGVAAMRLSTSTELRSSCPLRDCECHDSDRLRYDGLCLATRTAGPDAALSAVAVEEVHSVEHGSMLERIVAYSAEADPEVGREEARRRLSEARSLGFDGLLAAHEDTWAGLWIHAAVSIPDDPEAEQAVRFALFHILGSVGTGPEAAVGARGLSGPNYDGHVFWDADVFVLPVLAACRPEAARAMLRYRVNRLGAARTAANHRGRSGARFPWESARTGTDVTPRWFREEISGEIVPILTAEHEEHITADVAWAAAHYMSWTADEEFRASDGNRLLFETARYWCSRVDWSADGHAHLLGVIGPDEYHELVHDNAFTNAMARWNLRAAAAAVRAAPASGTGSALAEEAARWSTTAEALVDGFDPATGIYEQFAGFHALEPVMIDEFARPPVAANLLLGRDRLRGSQIIKQPDVLMLHHLVPDEVEPGSLRANLDHYLPRTAHGSSLSPAICASLLARAGRPDEALPLFRMAGRMDLDDLTDTTAGGLHLATMGGLWQAVAFGFAGLREDQGALRMDPILPSAWNEIELCCVFRGCSIRLRLRADLVEIFTDAPLAVALGTDRHAVDAPGERFARRGDKWREVRR